MFLTVSNCPDERLNSAFQILLEKDTYIVIWTKIITLSRDDKEVLPPFSHDSSSS